MLPFFDYTFYKLYLFTSSKIEANNRDWASSILTLLQGFNVLTIYITILYFFDIKTPSKTVIIIFAIFLIIFNYYRYQYSEKRSPAVLAKKWSILPLEKAKLYNALVLTYIIMTILVSVISIVTFYKLTH